MNLKEIEQLMHVLENSTLTRLTIRREGFELELEKELLAPSVQMVESPNMTQRGVRSAEIVAQSEGSPSVVKAEVVGRYITSPMVGSFYLTPSPEDPPFVKVGDEVEESSVVCIIEAMKVMNEVKAQMKGKVVEVLVKNGDPVEFGTKMFRIV